VIPRGAFGQAFFVTLAIAFTIAAAFVIASQQAGLQARQAGTTLIAKPDIEPSPVTSSTSIPPIEALIPPAWLLC
jgi:hypothetical protein